MVGHKFSYTDVEQTRGVAVLVGDVLMCFPFPLGEVKPEISIAAPEIVEMVTNGKMHPPANPIEINGQLLTACEAFEEANARFALAKHNVAELAVIELPSALK